LVCDALFGNVFEKSCCARACTADQIRQERRLEIHVTGERGPRDSRTDKRLRAELGRYLDAPVIDLSSEVAYQRCGIALDTLHR